MLSEWLITPRYPIYIPFIYSRWNNPMILHNHWSPPLSPEKSKAFPLSNHRSFPNLVQNGMPHHCNATATVVARRASGRVTSKLTIQSSKMLPSFPRNVLVGKVDRDPMNVEEYGGFLKWWVSPTTMGFPTKNDQHLGCFGGTTISRNTHMGVCTHPRKNQKKQQVCT